MLKATWDKIFFVKVECDGIVKPHRNVFIILSFFDKEVVIFLTYIGLKKQ